jgi:hypothetical protein
MFAFSMFFWSFWCSQNIRFSNDSGLLSIENKVIETYKIFRINIKNSHSSGLQLVVDDVSEMLLGLLKNKNIVSFGKKFKYHSVFIHFVS